MITNMTDHSRSMRFAEPSPRTWLAIEKYANVSSPVEAIPIDRMRAPLPYERLAGAGETLEADKQHRPGERRAHVRHLAVAREQPHERAPRPVVEMARRVAQRGPVRPAGHVQHPPQRLARHGHEQVTLRAASHLRERVLGVRHVL